MKTESASADCSIPPDLFTVVAALWLYPLFEREDATELDVLQSLVQCCVLVVGSSALTQGGLRSGLAEYGVVLTQSTIIPGNQVQLEELAANAGYARVVEILNLADVSMPESLMYAYCSAAILLIGKQLTTQSNGPWMSRRIKGLMHATAHEVDGDPAPFSLRAARALYLQASSKSGFRRSLVRMMLDIRQEESTRGLLCKAMLNLLAWSEMNHVRIIIENLYQRYPEILAMKPLSSVETG